MQRFKIGQTVRVTGDKGELGHAFPLGAQITLNAWDASDETYDASGPDSDGDVVDQWIAQIDLTPGFDVRRETGIETYVNDEPGDPNPGIILDAREATGKALTSAQARELAVELLDRANYYDSLG